MAKKKSAKKKTVKKKPAKKASLIAKVTPLAISLRSNSVNTMTVLVDQSYLEQISEKFDPIREATQSRESTNFEQLQKWAGRGQWLAIQSHPDILDGDGVPSLDLIFNDSKKKNTPALGHWFDPLSQYLDLPTGKLCVIYEDEFFHHVDESLKQSYLIKSSKDEKLLNKKYADAEGYIIECQPGFYRADSFTRFLESSFPKPGAPPEIAVYLTPIRKPKALKPSSAVLPYRTEQQDVGALRRVSLGLPPRKQQIQKPTLLKSGTYKANVHIRLSRMMMEMPKPFSEQIRLGPNQLATLEMEEIQIRGMVIKGAAPDPAFMHVFKKEEGNSSWFAMFKHVGDRLMIDLTAEPDEGCGLVEGESTIGQFWLDKEALNAVEKPKVALKAKENPDAISIPKEAGKPGPKVAALIPKIERCFSWTQICLFEVRGKTMVGAVNVCPPDKSASMGAEISATVAPFQDGQVGKESMKSFRGFPGGVDRAFAWIAGQAKGGFLWTTHFEVDLNFFNKRTRVSQKEALPASIAAWQEVFGVEEENLSKRKRKAKPKRKAKAR